MTTRPPLDPERFRLPDDCLPVGAEADKVLALFQQLRGKPAPGRVIAGMGYMMRCQWVRQWAVAYLLVWGRRPPGDDVLHWVFNGRAPAGRPPWPLPWQDRRR